MEKEENLDDIFDLKAILPEIYSSQPLISSGGSEPQTSDIHGSRRVNSKQLKSFLSWNSCDSQETISTKPSSSAAESAPKLISFENSNNTDYMGYKHFNVEMVKDYSLTSEIINFSSSAEDDSGGDNQCQDSANGISQKKLSTVSRTPLQALDHLMAERKRRENLSQLFISLSKVVPGLTKLDKASLLEDGIDYLKALQERVRVLEEEEMIKKSSIDTIFKDDSSSHKESSSGFTSCESAAPEIRTRISNGHVLIKIFCKKQMGLMLKIPGEMEKIHLNVIDMRIIPFGGAALDITILAEMQSEFEGTVKDIVDHLHTVFLNPRDNIMKDDHL